MALLVALFIAVGCGGSTKSPLTAATIASTVQAPSAPTSSPATTDATPTTVAVTSGTTAAVQQTGDPIDNSSGWVAVETNNVVFLSWIEAKGQLNGTIQIAALSKGQVTPMNRSFDGQHVGKQVSLNIEGLGVWQGTLDGSQLTLRVPQNDGTIGELLLTKGGIDRYNTAVRALQGGAADARAADAAAKAAAQADQELASAQASVTRAIVDLKADLPQLPEIMKIYDEVSHADMDASLAGVDRILATDPVYCPIASSAVGSVESARGTVSSQRGTLNISSSTIKSDVTKLRRAMDNLITVDPIFVRSDLADETDAAIKQATDNFNSSTAKADGDDQYADDMVTAAKERLKRYCS